MPDLSIKSRFKSGGLISGVAQTDDSSSSVGISWNAYLGTDNYVVSISNDAVNWVVADNYNYSPKPAYMDFQQEVHIT